MSTALAGVRAALEPDWISRELWRRARRRPTLDLDFAGTRSLRNWDGSELVTFTRASDATFVGADGLIQTASTNVPRFTHNPVTGECLGLLVEEGRTNLRTRSAEILVANAYGTNLASLTGVSGSSPLASSGTVYKFALDSGANTGNSNNGFHFGVGALASTTAHTQSLFVKLDGASLFRIRSNVTGQLFDFPLTGSAPAPSGTVTACTMDRYPDGWWRVSWTFTTTASVPGNRQDHWTLKCNVADGTSGLLVTGAQMEAGAFPTSYIPTAGTTVARAADVATITSGMAANNIRTLYAEFASPASGARGIISLNDNTANERLELSTSGTDPLAVCVDGGVTQASIDAGTIAANTRVRMAARFAANSFAASVNGGAAVIDASGTLPTVDRLFIGRTQAGEYLNGPIARLPGWTDELSDSVLQELTRA